jgi:chromosome segregation ATPase
MHKNSDVKSNSAFKLPLEDLALDLSTIIRGQQKLTTVQSEHFKLLIIGLNSKLKTLCLTQDRLKQSDHDSSIHLNSREAMHAYIKSASDKFQEINTNTQSEFKKIIENSKDTFDKLLKLQKDYEDKVQSEDQLLSKVLLQESCIKQLQNENKNIRDLEAMINDLKAQIKASEIERDAFRSDFRRTIKSFDMQVAQKDEEIKSLIENISKLQQKMLEKDKEIYNLHEISDSKETKIFLLESQIQELKSITKGLSDLESRCLSMETLSKTHQKECLKTQEKLKAACEDFKDSIASLNAEKLELMEKISSLSSKISSLNKDLLDKTSSYRSELVISQDLRTKSVIINQKLSNTIDTSKLFQQIKYLSTFSTEISDKITEDNELLTSSLIKSAEDYLNVRVIIKQTRDIIEDRDGEILILRELISELQSKTVYHAVRDDPVDEAIADYINSRSEPMQIQFVREEYGLYLFGTKRVFIKLENSKIISNSYAVRVGGGFMRIDEFINSYTPIELEKINERKVIRSNPKRKALMGKVLDNIGI